MAGVLTELTAAAVEASAAGTFMRGSILAYPLANLVHLAGLVLLIGCIGLLDLRLLGAVRALPVAAMIRYMVPAAGLGLVLLIASGIAMFAADATALAKHDGFRLKLLLILAGVMNAGLVHAIWLRRSAWQEPGRQMPPGLRIQAAVSLALWCWVAVEGRMIAYG
ncbi:MAG: hypothetical protein CMO29_24435 [Tistrella sp.]|jgi:hypothetical protein|nr:hypothetical protein [Tistrella sp.]